MSARPTVGTVFMAVPYSFVEGEVVVDGPMRLGRKVLFPW
jgi:hypothetical protein